MGVPVSLARRDEPRWLYRLMDAEGRLLYVGQTINPVARFRQWFQDAANAPHLYGWMSEVTSVKWQRFPTWWAVTAAEKVAIETELPAYNRQHRPARVA